MAARKPGKKAKRSSARSSATALRGKASKGTTWNPSQLDRTLAPALPEVHEPRPTVSRYPISNEAFEALKERAPRAKTAATTAPRSKDSAKNKGEVAARAMMPAAAQAGLEPIEAPSSSVNFAGMTSTGWIPPDCTLAVGPQHVLASVNSSVALYNKTGGAALFQRTLTQWFANVVTGMTIFDPKALYDQHEGRWVLLAMGVQNNPKTSVHLLSVSSSADPLGTWRNYRFNAMLDGTTATDNWADYPTLGVDNQALYVATNMFAFSGSGDFQYSKIRVIPKAGPYSGGTATYFDFVKMKNADNSMAFTIQPCHTFGAPQIEYLVNTGFPTGNFVTVWRITNPAGTPALTRTQVAVSPYSLAPNADQSGGAPPLNTGDVRVLHAVFRGDSIWTAFTTAHNWGTGTNKAAIEWCQIRAAAPALVQQGIYGAANSHYFYPASCPDNNGNLTMVFSRSGPTEFGSILFTGRRSTDPLGSLQASAMLKAGVAHYSSLDSGGRNRWGDYNGIGSDPSNARLVWFYSEFASAVDTWATWIGSAFF